MSDKFTDNELFNLISGSDVTGESTYDLWKSLGNEGGPQEFLEYLKDTTGLEEIVDQLSQEIADLKALLVEGNEVEY